MTKNKDFIKLFKDHWYCIKDLTNSEKAEILDFLFTGKMPEKKGDANIICKYIKQQQERIEQYSQEQSTYGKQGVIAKTLKAATRVAQGTSAPYPYPYPNPNPKEEIYIAKKKKEKKILTEEEKEINKDIKEILSYFEYLYEFYYVEPYIINYAKEYPLIKQLRIKSNKENILGKARDYFENRTYFFNDKGQRQTIGGFKTHFNNLKYMEAPDEPCNE